MYSLRCHVSTSNLTKVTEHLYEWFRHRETIMAIGSIYKERHIGILLLADGTSKNGLHLRLFHQLPCLVAYATHRTSETLRIVQANRPSSAFCYCLFSSRGARREVFIQNRGPIITSAVVTTTERGLCLVIVSDLLTYT